MTVVYVLAPDRTPLMPCTPAIARLLLKERKAKVVQRTPFTITLYAHPESAYAQPLTLGIDTGSAMIGSAVADPSGKIVYLSEVEVRNDLTTTLKQVGAKKGTLLHATQMNSIRVQLLSRVEAEETWGFVTKEHRLLAGLPKKHIFDATMIATRGTLPVFQTQTVLLKKCIPDGDYQQTKGKRSEQHITTGKIGGFRTVGAILTYRQFVPNASLMQQDSPKADDESESD